MTCPEFIVEHAPELIALPILLVGIAFFNAAETAFFNLRPAQLQRLPKGGIVGRILTDLVARSRRVLNTVLLGTMLLVTAYSAVTAVLLLALGKMGPPPWLIVVASFLPLLALILLAEIVPKSLALVAGERLAILLAVPLAVFERVLRPVLWVLENVFVRPLTRIIAPRPPGPEIISPGELAALLDLSARRGVINLAANELLQEIVALTDIRARDIMVPRVDMIACEVSAGPKAMAELFRESRLRRIPLYESDLDHILGVVHAKRLLFSPDQPLRKLAVKLPFLPEAANLERVLMQFRVTRAQTAIVVDEYGGTAGLVTLEDVLKEIVGEIPDPERPQRPLVERISRHEYLIDGELAIHEWEDFFQTDLRSQRISTVGGFVTALLDRMPKPGDTATYRNLKFTVESMQRRRIEKLRLELLPRAAETGQGGRR